MNKAKSILKRSLAILLAVLTLMSVGLTSVIALSIDMAETAANKDLVATGADVDTKIYFKPNSNWTQSSAKFEMYYWDSNGNHWKSMTKDGTTGFYTATLPAGFTNVIFVRMNPNGTEHDWSGKWNQSSDQTFDGTKNCFTLNGTNSGDGWNSLGGSWSKRYKYTVNANNSSYGTVSGSGYYTGDEISLTATPNEGYKFTGWTTDDGTTVSSDNKWTPSKDGVTVTANFALDKFSYTLNADPSDGGTVSDDGDGTGKVSPGTTLTITASPETGYEFKNWTFVNAEGGSTSASSTTFKPTANNATATAKFALKEYTVTFNDYDNSNIKEVTTKHGSELQITDPVRTGYTFDGWKAKSTGEVYATADLPKATGAETYTAQYSINKYTFKTDGFDPEKATMTITIGGEVINATADFERELDYNTTIHVNIEPKAPYTLTVGSEVVEGDLYDKDITIGASSKTLAISFSDRTFDVAINQTGSDEEGTVSIGEKVYTNENNTHKIVYGTRTISITAPEHYYIASVIGNGNYYTDDGSKENSTTVNVNVTANDDITITYAEMDKYTLTINQSGVDTTKEYHTYSHVIKIDDDVDSAITESPLVSHEFELYGGKHTLYIGAPHNHYIKSVKINNEDVTANAYNGTKYWIVDNYEFNLSADITIDVEYDYNPIISIEHKYSDGTTAGVVTTFTDGASIGDNQVLTNFNDSTDSISYTINALEGDYIVSITENGEVIYTDNGRFKTTFTPETAYSSLTEDKNIVVTYDKIPTYSLTIGEHSGGTIEDGDGTTIEVGTTTGIYGGTQFTYTAVPAEGYYFTGWDVTGTTVADASSKTITFTVTQDTTIKPNFAAAKGTITIKAGEGGQVTNEGEHSVTYPEIVASTASPSKSGYIFTGWEITGEENGDYKFYHGSKNTESIQLQILENRANITATAKFQDASKVTIYTYTDNGFNELKLTQSNGTENITNEYVQTPVTFGDKVWYTPGELTFTGGYNKVTAELSSGEAAGDDTVIYVKLSDKWMNGENENNTLWGKNKTPYLAITSSENAAYSDNINSSNQDGVKRYNNQDISYYSPAKDSGMGTGATISNDTYKWVIPSSYSTQLQSNGFTVYSKNNTGNSTWEINIVHFTYNPDVNYYIISDTYALGKDSNGDDRRTACFDAAENTKNYPTTTGEVDITEAFYDEDGNWIVENGEVWIYIDSSKNVHTSNRRALADYLKSGEVVQTYNKGVNDEGWEDNKWTAFINDYNAAVAALGDPSTTTDQANNLKEALATSMGALTRTTNITLIGTYGAYNTVNNYFVSGGYFGDIAFYVKDEEGNVTKVATTVKTNAKIDTTTGAKYIITDSFTRYDNVIVRSKVNATYATDYMVYGWVVNGNEWIQATYNDKEGYYEASYDCDYNATFVPIYLRKNTLDKDNTNVIKIYANIDTDGTEWGNYLAAYTWFEDSYRPFGEWGGQLMIPDTYPGRYYTFVEKTNPGNTNANTNKVSGITFNNYGATDRGDNYTVSGKHFYQTYDYMEFIELADQGKDTITFQLNEKTTTANWPEGKTFNVGDYDFEDLVNYSGKRVDITGKELTDQKTTDIGLYVVRTGPINPAKNDQDHDVGKGWQDLGTSEFYVNAYVYRADRGALVTRCKTYELKNFSRMLTEREVTLDEDVYKDKAVLVDYASLTDSRRFDGEWFGVKSSEVTVDISVQVALKNDGAIEYQALKTPDTPNISDVYGSAYINNAQTATVQMGTKDHQLTVTNIGNYAFKGWYLATDDDKDDIYTIDTSVKPLQNGERTIAVDAGSDAVYIALFEELTSGSFTVFNQYYSHSFFNTPISGYAPTPQSENPALSNRYVDVVKIYDASDDSSVSGGSGRVLTKDSLTLQDITEGDKLKITIRTVPTRENDFVYAWYIQANDEYGINFEEVGLTDEIFDYDTDKGQGKEFTFEYTVKKDERSLTIYSDIFHYSSDVNLVYVYNNRYNQQRKYIVKYELNDEEIKNNHTPSDKTIEKYAPYVEDYYKDVSWKAATVSEAGTVWTIYAVEDKTYEVNIAIDGKAYDPIYGEFNDAMDIYASELDTSLSTVKGIWYEEVGTPNGVYNAGTDKVIGYGNYLGLAITRDMNLVYTTDAELIYQIILDAPVYGREQDNSGETTIDTIYADYLISYMLPHFHDDTINVNGKDVTLSQDTDRHTPVQVQTLRDAGLTVEYGIVTELINTDGPKNPDGSDNEAYKSYYNKDSHITKSNDGELTLKALQDVLNDKELDIDKNGKATGSGYAEGVGVYEGTALKTYFYAYNAENISNKNRVLKTFKFSNPKAYDTYYYNVYGYLVISDGNETHYYISNVQTLSMNEALKQTYDNIATP